MTTTTMTMSPDPAEVERLLALSDERDQWMRFALAMWLDGFGAPSGDLDDTVLCAFADGWHCGLQAGAERGSSA